MVQSTPQANTDDEWGGREIETGITDRAVGAGLSNTNSLIGMNLQSYTSGWHVVWDKIKEFRQSRSNNWFLPSTEELGLIYKARSNLSNLSLNTGSCYCSSSEQTSSHAYIWYFDIDSWRGCVKSSHNFRSRLYYTI